MAAPVTKSDPGAAKEIAALWDFIAAEVAATPE